MKELKRKKQLLEHQLAEKQKQEQVVKVSHIAGTCAIDEGNTRILRIFSIHRA